MTKTQITYTGKEQPKLETAEIELPVTFISYLSDYGDDEYTFLDADLSGARIQENKLGEFEIEFFENFSIDSGDIEKISRTSSTNKTEFLAIAKDLYSRLGKLIDRMEVKA